MALSPPQQTLQQKWVELGALLLQERRLLHGTSPFPGRKPQRCSPLQKGWLLCNNALLSSDSHLLSFPPVLAPGKGFFLGPVNLVAQRLFAGAPGKELMWGAKFFPFFFGTDKFGLFF